MLHFPFLVMAALVVAISLRKAVHS